MWVNIALFVSICFKSDFSWYAEYLKSWRRKKLNQDFIEWGLTCTALLQQIPISISIKIVYQVVKQQLATCACVLVHILPIAIQMLSTILFLSRFLFRGPESCKTESSSFLNRSFYDAYTCDVQTHTNMNDSYVTLLCNTGPLTWGCQRPPASSFPLRHLLLPPKVSKLTACIPITATHPWT